MHQNDKPSKRDEWLAKRRTPRKPKQGEPGGGNLVFVSTGLMRLKDGPNAGSVIMWGKGRTYVKPKDGAQE